VAADHSQLEVGQHDQQLELLEQLHMDLPVLGCGWQVAGHS